MNAWLKRYAERIDAASLRERVLIFLALALVLIFVANIFLLQPLRAKQKRLASETAQRQERLRVLQGGLQKFASPNVPDPDAEARRKRGALQAELLELNARVSREQARFTPPERMRAVLEELLERNKRLVLVDLKTLAAVPLQLDGPARGSAYRHGIEIAVSGTYMDLYEYVRSLERLPHQLYWGRSSIEVTEHPHIVMKLTLYTVSFDKAWLIV